MKGFQVEPEETVSLEFEGKNAGAEVVCATDVPLSLYLEIRKPAEEGKRLEASAAMLKRFGDQALISWNLQDKNREPIPATGDGMLEVPQAFAAQIFHKWVAAVTEPSDPLGPESIAGNGSLEASMPMAPL